MKKRGQFSKAELTIIAIAAAVVIAVVAWIAFAPKADQNSQESSVSNKQTTVEKESDLYKVDATLDGIELEDADSAKLDDALKTF